MLYQAVMKPEPKISGFIDRLPGVAVVASQYSLQSLPGPGNAGAEYLYVEGPDGYVPPQLVEINPDKQLLFVNQLFFSPSHRLLLV